MIKKLLQRFGYYKYERNIGYNIINWLDKKVGTLGISNYDDQEELAEHVEWMIKNEGKE